MNQKILSLAVLFTLIVLTSCKEETDDLVIPQYESGAQLQRIVSVPYGSTGGRQVIEEYQYDSSGRLHKIIYADTNPDFQYYKQYFYNNKEQLIKVAHFNSYDSEKVNILNQTFTYVNNKLEKEQQENPVSGTIEYTLYRYEDEKLVETKKYGKEDELQYYIAFEHDSKGRVMKESTFDISGNLMSELVHSYSQGLPVTSISYAGDNHEVVREDTRYYDNNANLVILKSKAVASWLSSVSYEHHYEYSDR